MRRQSRRDYGTSRSKVEPMIEKLLGDSEQPMPLAQGFAMMQSCA
jgi:hypothetical protein